MKRCLILSYGPVPTPEQNRAEGGGLRCWGLAKGLFSQKANIEITVAYKEDYRKETFTDKYEGINIATWNAGGLPSLIKGYDTIIISYCMGELSNEVTRLVRPDQQLVLDCYVPIYLEISARGSADLAGEYAAFESEVENWAKVLRRGDLFLCANDNQKRFYQGVLAALGRINPATYGEELILVAPYGIYRDKPVQTDKPIDRLMGANGKDGVKRLLWFGAIYPWFDLRKLVDAVNIINKTVPTKLIIVGAKNPFNYHPDFVRRYEELIEHIDKNKESQRNTVIQEWVNFDERANWYLGSDLVILINKIGDENELAWRTRLVDFMWADLPIVTNGGDPLGEELIAGGAAARLEHTDAEGMANDLIGLLSREEQLSSLRKNIAAQRSKFYWDVVTKSLCSHILAHTHPRDIKDFGLLKNLPQNVSKTHKSTLRKVARKAKMAPVYYKKYGVRKTISHIAHRGIKR
jgi:glycosyltransferase involved in cell wall biosynthesis